MLQEDKGNSLHDLSTETARIHGFDGREPTFCNTWHLEDEIVYLLNYLLDLQVKLNLSKVNDITDDIDFCFKLAQEESVIILPGKKKLLNTLEV